MDISIKRREFVAGLGAAGFTLTCARPAWALDRRGAENLAASAVAMLEGAINSGASEKKMYQMFLSMFRKYADLPIIARASLGVVARSASPGELSEYESAFEAFLVAKYTRRFREFVGARIEIGTARGQGSFWTVGSTVHIPGQGPFDLVWQVSDKSGEPRFFNLVIDGVNMLALERSEIGAMLDQSHGNLPALSAELRAKSAL